MEQWTFLQFPAPYWISNRAHTITRLGLTRCHSGFEPPADLDPRSKSASGYGPPGPNPLADLDSPPRIWTPSKTEWNIILDVLVEILYVPVRIKVCFWFKTCNWQLEMTLSNSIIDKLLTLIYFVIVQCLSVWTTWYSVSCARNGCTWAARNIRLPWRASGSALSANR